MLEGQSAGARMNVQMQDSRNVLKGCIRVADDEDNRVDGVTGTGVATGLPHRIVPRAWWGRVAAAATESEVT